MRYLMSLPAPVEALETITPTLEIVTAMRKYNDEMGKAGVLVLAEGLHPSSQATRMKIAQGQPVFTDGPFTEAKEIIAGFWIIEVKSKEEAIEWAKRCPLPEHAQLELRPVFANNDFPPELRNKHASKTANPVKRAPLARIVKGTKTDSGAADVDAYLASVPEPARSTLKKIRANIRSAVPREATEAISYGMPAFRYNGFLVGYAAFAKHCSFFPGSGSILQRYPDDLKGLEVSKGTIRFPQEKPLPARLLKKLVKERVEKNRAKKAK
jgi:uncharacterized protein YdhG (YjbR/CyaY superfamily)